MKGKPRTAAATGSSDRDNEPTSRRGFLALAGQLGVSASAAPFFGRSPDGAASRGAASAGIINVRERGAVGDGVTDDTAVIQRCIDEAGQTGETVYVPAGLYLISQSIILAARRIRLVGDGSTVPKSPGAVTGGISERHGSILKSAIEDPTAPMIHAAGQIVPEFADGLRYCLGTQIRGIALWGTGGEGDAIRFDVNGYTIDTTIDDVTIWGVGRTGLRWERSGLGILHCLVSNVRVWQPREDGFFLQANGGNQHCVGFRLENLYCNTAGRSSWYSRGLRQFQVSNFIENDAVGHGFHVVGARQATFKNCQAETDRGSGWYLDDTTDSHFDNCTAVRNVGSQWRLANDSDNNSFVHCVIAVSGREDHVTFDAGSHNRWICTTFFEAPRVTVVRGKNNWSIGDLNSREPTNPLTLRVLGKAARVTVDGDNIFLTGARVVADAAATTLGSRGGALGFYGAAGVHQPVLPTGAGKSLDDVIAALQAINLVRQR